MSAVLRKGQAHRLRLFAQMADIGARFAQRQRTGLVEDEGIDLRRQFDVGDVLVFGSETSGLPDAMVNEVGDHALQIPMGPNVRSINLSCSVAITGYEAYRQFVSDGRIDEG